QIPDGGFNGSSAVNGLVSQKFSDHSQNMLSTFLWGDILLHHVGKDQGPNSVVIFDGGKCQKGCQLSSQFILKPSHRAKVLRAAQIHQKHYGQLPFFNITFYVKASQPGGNIPVDSADIIAILILAHLIKFHTPAFEY